MLEITVGAEEVYDESTETFSTQGGTKLQLEHSLVSLSKWESVHEINFLGNESLTQEQRLDYVRCMILTENSPGDILNQISPDNYIEIQAYLEKRQSATWFSELHSMVQTQREIITTELVYYWMTQYGIPFTCETWPFSRLMALVKIASIKTEKPKKMSRAQVAERNRMLNEQRKKQLGTKG